LVLKRTVSLGPEVCNIPHHDHQGVPGRNARQCRRVSSCAALHGGKAECSADWYFCYFPTTFYHFSSIAALADNEYFVGGGEGVTAPFTHFIQTNHSSVTKVAVIRIAAQF
jgi:hypothetical protein